MTRGSKNWIQMNSWKRICKVEKFSAINGKSSGLSKTSTQNIVTVVVKRKLLSRKCLRRVAKRSKKNLTFLKWWKSCERVSLSPLSSWAHTNKWWSSSSTTTLWWRKIALKRLLRFKLMDKKILDRDCWVTI